MSVTFGCLSLMSLRNPFAEFVSMVLGKSDLRSILCILIVFIVSLVLAYLTNPSENSFRAYLTEQSFRHHLSCLDDQFEDDHRTRHKLFRRFSASLLPHPVDNALPFHFTNRASISLRTPKHVFHSCAVFTVAAMVPLSKGSHNDDRDGWSISDSWYIGAFGKWWRGGVLETWYQDVIARSKDEESWSSGILSMKNLDMFPDFNGPSFTPKNLPHYLLRGPPPKLRSRDRQIPRSLSARSSTPPPLSKTASLPLHSARLPLPSDGPCDYLTQSCRAPMSPSGGDSVIRLGLPSRSQSNSFEQSPLIAEVLRQISTSTASAQELRTQLSECHSTAAHSHGILRSEVDSYRDRKRQEDTLRVELKTRTKILDDSKRSAEIFKRNAGKKLRAAQHARDSAIQRAEHLDAEISLLHGQLDNDQIFLNGTMNNRSEAEVQLSQALEEKKSEIKLTEELLLALNRRSRELEETLIVEKERLNYLKVKAGPHKDELSAAFERSLNMSYSSSYNVARCPGVLPHPTTLIREPRATTSVSGNVNFASSGDFPHPKQSSRPALASCVPSTYGPPIHAQPSFTDGLSLSNLHHLGKPNESGTLQLGVSAPSLHCDNAIGEHSSYDPRVSQSQDGLHLHKYIPNTRGLHFAAWNHRDVMEMSLMPFNIDSDGDSDKSVATTDKTTAQPRVAAGMKPRKGLNPDAKVFNLSRKSSPGVAGLPLNVVYDALNPTGVGLSAMSSTSSTNASLLRAFAPSPAEREVLQKALGGSTNASFECLPSLSDVGSIPSSPSHVHVLPLAPHPLQHTSGNHNKVLNLPSWLSSLPNVRNSKFRPWDDEEPVVAERKGDLVVFQS